MKIVSTSPADGWFFYFKVNQKMMFYRLAVWATYEDGSVGGLLPAERKDDDFKLVGLPSAEVGGYIHWDDLSDKQRENARGTQLVE